MELTEKDIIKIIKSDVNLPVHYQNVVRKTLDQCRYKEKNKILNVVKIIAAICASFIMTTGIVYGAYIIYEKVWKEPKQYSQEEFLSILPSETFTDEEKMLYITENQAKEKALEVLEKLDYENQTINRIELKRSYDSYSSAYYMLNTQQGLMVAINAETGEFNFFEDWNIQNRAFTADEITELDAQMVCEEIYKKLGLVEGKYEFYKAKKMTSTFGNVTNKDWHVTFCKKYNGIFNENESFGVRFIVANGTVNLISCGISHDANYVENELKIKKEQAVNIALTKELEYSQEDIKNIEAIMSIEKMNTFFYRLDNNVGDNKLVIDDVSRRVWKISIIHKKQENPVQKQYDRCYYVDISTGEIIGGESIINGL